MASPIEQIPFDATLPVDQPLHELYAAGEEDIHGFRHLPDKNLLMRRVWGSDIDRPDQPEFSLNLFRMHYQVLRRFGMCIVSNTQEVLPPDMRRPVVYRATEEIEDQIVAHSAAHFVSESRPLLRKDEEKTPVEPARIHTLVTDPLSLYVGWCRRTRQSYVLSDVYSLDQYSVQVSSGIIFLHDIDPLLLKRSVIDFTRIEENIKRMRLGLL